MTGANGNTAQGRPAASPDELLRRAREAARQHCRRAAGKAGPVTRHRDVASPLIAKALSHPLRASLLEAISEGQASPNELAKKFGAPLTNVSYHVRMLHELGCIELVDTAPRRGALEHYYRARVRNARVEYEIAGRRVT